VCIPGKDVVDSWRSDDAALGPGRGKENAVPFGSASKARSWSLSGDTETSSEETTPPERKRRLIRSDRSLIDGLPLPGQQAPKKAVAPQPIPKATTSMVPGGFGGGRFAATAKEATVVKKAAEAMTEEAATVKATEDTMAKAVAEDAMTATMAAAAAAAAVSNAVAVAGFDGSGGGGPDMV
jgi:hypothetical protein